jgi:hypothetical protein
MKVLRSGMYGMSSYSAWRAFLTWCVADVDAVPDPRPLALAVGLLVPVVVDLDLASRSYSGRRAEALVGATEDVADRVVVGAGGRTGRT